jgi:hypothetical protein
MTKQNNNIYIKIKNKDDNKDKIKIKDKNKDVIKDRIKEKDENDDEILNYVFNPRAIMHLKQIVELLFCINENLTLLISLIWLSNSNDIINKLLWRTCLLYNKLITHLYCKDNYYFVKCFRSVFKKCFKLLYKLCDSKPSNIIIYDTLFQINCKQTEILSVFKNYKNKMQNTINNKLIC